MPSQISPQAFVHDDAIIGEGVVIEPFAYIGPSVKIGDRTWIGPNANIIDRTTIGADCKIFPGAVVGAVPQDLKFADDGQSFQGFWGFGTGRLQFWQRGKRVSN